MPARKGRKSTALGGPGGNAGANVGKQYLDDEQKEDMIDIVVELLGRRVPKRTIKAACRQTHQQMIGDPTARVSADRIEEWIRIAKQELRDAAPAICRQDREQIKADLIRVHWGAIADPQSTPDGRSKAAERIDSLMGISPKYQLFMVMPQTEGQSVLKGIDVQIITDEPARALDRAAANPPKRRSIIDGTGGNGSSGNGSSGNGSGNGASHE